MLSTGFPAGSSCCAGPQHRPRIPISLIVPSSDSPPAKRPFTDVINPYRPLITPPSDSSRLALPSTTSTASSRSLPQVDRKCLPPSIPRKRSMQASSDQPSCGQPLPIPSPTFSRCSDSLASPTRDAFFPSATRAIQSDTEPAQSQFLSYHRYRNSASTSASVSTDSSPTTTASLNEGSTAETPGTSPDTPASYKSYTYPSLSMAMHGTQEQHKPELRAVPAPFSKKPRNLKNLAVNTSSTFPLPRAVSTATFPMEQPRSPPSSSAISLSPALVLPSNPPRRKPGGPGLTIKTPATGTFPLQQIHPIIPSTPSLPRPATLRSFQSTSAIPLHSAGLPPEGGMRLPPFVSKLSEAPLELEEERPFSSSYGHPELQEKQPDAYPHGPICIYDPHVYLYFEPTAEEASSYDVIFNVASEVKNPFSSDAESRVHTVDLRAAVKALAEQPESPSTPRAGAATTESTLGATDTRPEYIHVPWEHNTDIVPGTDQIPSLHDIIRIIDSRVKQGKRVLIHCQCGVSRSASLIVAYGLYKNPSITVQEAYDAVKNRSEWIGPNMNLIMQLQEFRNILRLGSKSSNSTQSTSQKPGARLHGRTAPGGNGEGTDENVPQTAPLPQSPKLDLPSINTQNLRDVSPGPSSAPSDFHWPSSARVEKETPTSTATPTLPQVSIFDNSGQVLQTTTSASENPAKNKKGALAIRTEDANKAFGENRLDVILPNATSDAPPEKLNSVKSAEFAMAPLRSTEADDMFGLSSPRPIELTAPPTFVTPQSSSESALQDSIMSPRSSEFAMTPIRQADTVDDMFGLSSPRTNTFTTQLPHRSQDEPVPRVTVLQPPPTVNIGNAQARAELRSQLGLNSTKSHNDMRAAYVESGEPRSKTVTPLAPVPSYGEPASDSDLGDALMSPRATEFTANPFHDALMPNHDGSKASDNPSGDATPVAYDPRSPPLKGGSPIVRSIFDVLQ